MMARKITFQAPFFPAAITPLFAVFVAIMMLVVLLNLFKCYDLNVLSRFVYFLHRKVTVCVVSASIFLRFVITVPFDKHSRA